MPKKLEQAVNEILRPIIMVKVYLAKDEGFEDLLKRIFCPYCRRKIYNPHNDEHYYSFSVATLSYEFDEKIDIPLVFKFLCTFCQNQFLVGVSVIRREEDEDL